MPSNLRDLQLVDLNAERVVKLARMQALDAGAERAKRELSRTEHAEWTKLEREVGELNKKIDETRSKFDPRLTQGDAIDGGDAGSAELLAPEQRVSDWARERGQMALPKGLEDLGDPDRFSLGRMIRGAVTGEWEGADLEHRALSETALTGGGYLIPTPLAAQMIDRVRNAMQVMAAGATTVPMTANVLNLARLGTGASVSWKAENAAINQSSMLFERLQLSAFTLPIIVTLSAELFEDLSPTATELIETEVAAALSLELDRACLRGVGTTEPKGIRNQSGITLQSLGANGSVLNWDNIIDAVSNVRNLNIEPTAMIMASRSSQALGKVKDSTGRYIGTPPNVANVKLLSSNQVPITLTQGTSGPVASEIYTGRFSDLLVGIRTDMRMQVRVLTERYIDNLQYGLLCYLRGDVALAHPESFNVTTGVL